MEQNCKPRNKQMCMGKFLTKEPKTYNGEMKASSINGAGKMGQPCAKA